MVSEEVQGRITRKVCLACNREFTGIAAACPHDGTVLIPLEQDQLVGTKLADRYHILSVVGKGGMGVVYKAKHELMDRIVAIKMLLAQLISDSMSVKRFQQEAKAASRLKHPNVITLYDFGVSPTGQPYLVMDFLEGSSLSEIIKKDGQVGVERSIRVLTQACDALEHAHHQGVIHRDLKPGNIMLIQTEDEKDFVKVVDFGVAKLMPWAGDSEAQRLTQTGEVCGSPVYMSPEQCMGQKLDARSDIYSMGVVIYEALTGRLPLLGKNMVDTMSKHISEMPGPFSEVRPDLYIPERLEAVVFKALQKEPDNRHQSMAELGQELQFAIPRPGKSATLRVSTEMPSVAPKPKEKAGVPLPLAIGAAALLMIAFGVLGFMAFNKPALAPQPAKAPVAPAPPAPSKPQAKTAPMAVPAVVPTPAPAPTKSPSVPKPQSVAAPPVVSPRPSPPATPVTQVPASSPLTATPARSVPRKKPVVARPTRPASAPKAAPAQSQWDELRGLKSY